MKYHHLASKEIHSVEIQSIGDRYKIQVGSEVFEAKLIDFRNSILCFRIANTVHRIYFAKVGRKRWISFQGCTHALEKDPPKQARAQQNLTADVSLRSPMPAQVRSILVGAGQNISQGDTLMLLEAMKMEIVLRAPRSGVVSQILVEVGANVNQDQILIELEA